MPPLAENVKRCYDSFHFSFTPLTGKRPRLTGWQELPRETLEQALAWAAEGNVGLRTGHASGGLLVIDIDQGGDHTHLGLPPTAAVRTGSGGLHLYYLTPEPLGNSCHKLGPKIDTRGEGGQVVFPGSVHPVTNQAYEWCPGMEPWTVGIATLPAHVIALLKAEKKTERKKPDADPASASKPNFKARRWAAQALKEELKNVLAAVEGTRNDTLNVAAFNLGQIVGGGYLSRTEVVGALMDAAKGAGLTHNEAWATIGSGIDSGIEKPRVYEPRPEDAARLAKAVAVAAEAGYVMKPGPHVTDDGEYVEQSADTFAAHVIERLSDEAIYRKDGMPGSVFGVPGRRRWDQMDDADAVLAIDRDVKCCRWIKDKDGEPLRRYESCTMNDAKLVLSKSRGHPKIRELRAMVNYPVYGPDWNLLAPGWRDGLYYDQPPELEGLEPDTDCEWIHNVLLDLVCDFPFRSAADRENFFGLLLTPLIAPALQGNRPLHLVHASLERTGKSKLAGDVLGITIQGRQVPAMQITEREEEREKRITSLLLKGDTLVHLDNLPGFIDSQALASLLTSQDFCTRILRESRQVALPNFMTVVASGNNVQFTAEVAKRIVPILLQPTTASPESRQDFQHPDLTEFLRSQRRTVLACLLGMVENWKKAGRPLCKTRLGGFEEWASVVGGILAKNSFKAWRTNEKEWRETADPRSAELDDFVEAWAANFGTAEVLIEGLIALAKERDVFAHVLAKPGQSGRVSFGHLLQKQRDKPVGQWVIRYVRAGGVSRYQLEAQQK